MLNKTDAGYEIKGQLFTQEEAQRLRDALLVEMPLFNKHNEYVERIMEAHGVQ